MIWTRVAVSISYDDNDYTTGTSSLWISIYQQSILKIEKRGVSSQEVHMDT